MIARVKLTPNGNKIRNLIAKKGMSLKSFSRLIPVSYPYLSRIVNNRVEITPQMAKKISDNLNTSIDSIFLFNLFTNSKTKNKEK